MGETARVAILWKQMSGYARASFAALQDAGADVYLAHRSATEDAPFDDDRLTVGAESHVWSEAPDEDLVRGQLERFKPDAVLVISWDVGAYRRISRSMRGRTLRILCMDNPWLATPKQWAGRAAARMLIRPTYDVAFLPGERQATFARYLGFTDDEILWGLYTCDYPTFAAVRDGRADALAPAFLFVGRLVASKGADVLAHAYREYRAGTADPWPLVVCGTGPMADAFAGIPGVEMLGFVQPEELPHVLARSACLVTPSRFEPWGVVLHEATAAGLGVICSSACGASTRLVLDGYNGAVVPVGDATRLAEAMTRISSPTTDLAAIGRRSGELASQFTPQRWATYLLERIAPLRRQVGIDR